MLKIYKPIVIIIGSPKTIFYEIFFKSLKIKSYKSPLILISNLKTLKLEMKKFNFKKKINSIELNDLNKDKTYNHQINIIDVNLENSTDAKKNLIMINNYIKQCFQIAFKIIKKGHAYKVLNGPINKKQFLNKKFLGVTEYISHKFTKKKVGMLIYNKKLSVCPVTTHLPIRLVSRKITKKLIEEKIDVIDNFFKKNLKLKSKIAVVGLNPHCESILKYNEDEKIISAAIRNRSKKGINVKGPYSADTIFLKANREKFNVILGMYHDQVLTPLKALFEYDAINITMGLPFLRVSPDHGPNEKMIGKNKSNPLSLVRALEFLDKN
jgi:4-hydroxy-L-threonine phosphate dehydrogenase PdxA